MRQNVPLSRREALSLTGSVSLIGVAGLATGQSGSTVAAAPVPSDSDAYAYPTMGTNPDAPTVTVYGNYKCPYTVDFVQGNLEPIVEEFVATGQLNLEFYNLAYAPGSSSSYFISSSDPRIAAFSIGVWDQDPDSFWQFHEETFADMPSGYVTYDDLAARARDAGVSNVDEIVDRAESGQYDSQVESVSSAAANRDIDTTPRLVLGGDKIPATRPESTVLNWIEERVGEAPDDGGDEPDQPDEPDESDEPDQPDEPDESDPDDGSENGSGDGGDDGSSGDDGADDAGDDFDWVEEPEDPTEDDDYCPYE